MLVARVSLRGYMSCFFLAKNFLSAPNHPSPVVCSNPSSDKSKAKKVISFFFNHTKPFVELANEWTQLCWSDICRKRVIMNESTFHFKKHPKNGFLQVKIIWPELNKYHFCYIPLLCTPSISKIMQF